MATATATITMTAQPAFNVGNGGGAAAAAAADEENQRMWNEVVTAAMQDKPYATALVALATADRNTTQASIDENVQKALSHPSTAAMLVNLLFHVRNHEKSQSARQGGVTGSGERQAAERMLLALFRHDPDAAFGVASLLPFYGSWSSVARLMQATMAIAEEDSTVDWARLRAHLYDVYAEQMKTDQAAADADKPVSNASKFAPHEKRKRIASAHGDEIARRVFGLAAVPTKGSPAHTGLRRRWRKLRVQLNNTNAHIAEKFLSEKRAGQLDTRQITAGALSAMRKALLNLTKKNTERTTDAGRRALRAKMQTMLAKEKPNVVVPSDLRQLADTLVRLDESTADRAEVQLLEAGYNSLVRSTEKKVVAHMQKAQDLLKQLRTVDQGGGAAKDGPLDQAAEKLAQALAHDPTRCAVAIDVTATQTGTIPTAALLSLVLADVELSLAVKRHAAPDNGGGGAAEFDDEAPSSVVLFGRAARTVEVPAGTIANPPHRRLRLVYEAAQALSTSRDGDFGRGAAAGPDYTGMFRTISSDLAFAGRHIIVASDFANTAAFVGAMEGWRAEAAGTALVSARTAAKAAAAATAADSRLVTAWRLQRPLGERERARKRTRLPVYDLANPRMDIVFVMDTTASMGTWIRCAQQKVIEMVQSLATQNDVAARAAFVSYRDFGDAGHPTMTPWCDMQKPMHQKRLQTFINGLLAVGGGDAPEDVATGLESAERLFALSHNCIKVVVLIADAPAHGMTGVSGQSSSWSSRLGMTDDWPTRNGVCQRRRTLKAVSRLAAGGAELMFAQCTHGGGGLEKMTQMFDDELLKHNTFLDAFSIAAGSTAFAEKISSAVGGLLAQAVAPAGHGGARRRSRHGRRHAGAAGQRALLRGGPRGPRAGADRGGHAEEEGGFLCQSADGV